MIEGAINGEMATFSTMAMSRLQKTVDERFSMRGWETIFKHFIY